MIEITKDNVKELWELYENYLNEFRQNHYSNVEPAFFETYVCNDVKKCQCCGEYRDIEEMGTSELALEDEICQYCMEDGYGK